MKSFVEITPAVLAKNFADLKAKLERVVGASGVVQIDVVDGVYAPSVTWPYDNLVAFERVLAGDEGLPCWEDIDFEFDLMVADPLVQVERYVAAGASRVIVHAKSHGSADAIQKVQPFRTNDELAVLVGVALSVDARVEDLDLFHAHIDYVQVMGIEAVGFQGHPFDPRATMLVSQLRERYPHLPIQVDGAVSLANARALAVAGATRLVVGSAIFSSEDPRSALRALYTEANASV